jgi:hypothetical protein
VQGRDPDSGIEQIQTSVDADSAEMTQMSLGLSELHTPETEIIPYCTVCTSPGSMCTMSSKLISKISFDDDARKITVTYYSLQWNSTPDYKSRPRNVDPLGNFGQKVDKA